MGIIIGASLLIASTAQALPTVTKTAVPLKASGYHYQQVAWGAGDAGFEAPAYDDSSWAVGSAAFGTTFGPCAFKTNVVTPWDLGTDILLRKTFALPKSATQLTVTGTVDNDATVFVNGQQIGYVQSGFCNENAINLTAPNTALVAGANLLAVRGHGDPDAESYIDQQVTYQVPLYSLCLLYDPAKSVKAGSTIPLKIQLCDASANNLSSPSITVHALSLAKVDNSASAIVEDSGSANPGDDFRYDAALGGSGGYIFNKSTKGLTSGTWRLTLTVDGDAESAYQLLFDVR